MARAAANFTFYDQSSYEFDAHDALSPPSAPPAASLEADSDDYDPAAMSDDESAQVSARAAGNESQWAEVTMSDDTDASMHDFPDEVIQPQEEKEIDSKKKKGAEHLHFFVYYAHRITLCTLITVVCIFSRLLAPTSLSTLPPTPTRLSSCWLELPRATNT